MDRKHLKYQNKKVSLDWKKKYYALENDQN